MVRAAGAWVCGVWGACGAARANRASQHRENDSGPSWRHAAGHYAGLVWCSCFLRLRVSLLSLPRACTSCSSTTRSRPAAHAGPPSHTCSLPRTSYAHKVMRMLALFEEFKEACALVARDPRHAKPTKKKISANTYASSLLTCLRRSGWEGAQRCIWPWKRAISMSSRYLAFFWLVA